MRQAPVPQATPLTRTKSEGDDRTDAVGRRSATCFLRIIRRVSRETRMAAVVGV